MSSSSSASISTTTTRTGTGADAELTTLIFDVAARRIPLRCLLSRIPRYRSTTTATTSNGSSGGRGRQGRGRGQGPSRDGRGCGAIHSILSIPGIDGAIPLYRACQFGSTAMVSSLLERGVYHRVAAGGLFVECRLSEEERYNNENIDDSDRSEWRLTRTPMDMAVERIRLSDRRRKKSKKAATTNRHNTSATATANHEEDEDDKEDWEVLALCIRYADAARYRRRPPETIAREPMRDHRDVGFRRPNQDMNGGQQHMGNDHTRDHGVPRDVGYLIAAIGIVPVDLIVSLIGMCHAQHNESITITTDSFGRNILTKAIHLATESQQQQQYHIEEEDEQEDFNNWTTVFQTLFDIINNNNKSKPNEASTTIIRDKRNRGERSSLHTTKTTPTQQKNKQRHPLFLAAEYGLDWCNGMAPILQSNYNLLLEQDPITQLYPFMLAASGIDLETTTNTTTSHCRWVVVLDLLKRLLEMRYRVLGNVDPWIDLYVRFCSDSVGDRCCRDDGVGSTTMPSHFRKMEKKIERKKKEEFWNDILHGSKVAFMDEHITILNQKTLSIYDKKEGITTTLSKDEAYSFICTVAESRSNLNAAFELLRQNPAILNRFVTSVNATIDNDVTVIDDHREKKRRKQRNRRKRLRKSKNKSVMT